VTIVNAGAGELSYQWSDADMTALQVTNYQIYASCQLPSETSPRGFYLGVVVLLAYPGGVPVTEQDVNLNQIGGANIATSYGSGFVFPPGMIPVVLVVPPNANAQPVGAALGAFVDGAIATLGKSTDAANAATVLGQLKELVTQLSGTLGVSGAVSVSNFPATQPISAASLPLPAGAALEAGNLATLLASLGAVGDAAWSGSGNGTGIAILKKIETLLAATLLISGSVTAAVSGSVTANAGTNLNTSTLALENGGKLASILTALQGLLQVEQADLSATGTISTVQPVIGTPVSNATVALAVGQGQSTWKAQLLNGGGGFTSATTIVADKSADGGTTWYSASFKVAGASPATPVSSVTGSGPVEMTGDCAGVTHVRIRCSVLNASETIAVTLRGSAGISDIGLISSIPAGSNVIGGVTAASNAFADGAITTLGTEADAAWGLSGNATVIAALKELALLLQHVAYDNTNELKTSLYGKNSVAGDTPLAVNSAGQAQVEDIEQSGYVALSTPPTNTNAGSDTTLTFSSQVNRVILQNNTSANAYLDFDQAASTASLVIVPGALLIYPKKCTSPHLYTAVATPINAVNGLLVRGAL